MVRFVLSESVQYSESFNEDMIGCLKSFQYNVSDYRHNCYLLWYYLHLQKNARKSKHKQVCVLSFQLINISLTKK